MWFSICNKITPRTTLSLHFTWAVALPCIRSPLFFCSPATMTISPISVIYCFLWFLSCGSASDCWQTPFANDAMRFLLNSSVVCLALWPLLPRSQCLQTRAHFPPPTLTRIALMFLAPLPCSWHALVAGCWDASWCQWRQSPTAQRSGARFPESCKGSSLPLKATHASLPTVATWRDWISCLTMKSCSLSLFLIFWIHGSCALDEWTWFSCEWHSCKLEIFFSPPNMNRKWKASVFHSDAYAFPISPISRFGDILAWSSIFHRSKCKEGSLCMQSLTLLAR